MRRPAQQRSPHPRKHQQKRQANDVPTVDDGHSDRVGAAQKPLETATVPQRHGDRGGRDDAVTRLPIFVRFRDIKAAGIAHSWTQLMRLIDDEGFPFGMMLSANMRAWRLDKIEAWLDGRPTERKATPDPWPKSRRKAAEEKRAARHRADANAPATVSQ